MAEFALRVDNSPFGQDQADLINRVVPSLTPDQLIWLSGYLTGLRGRLSASAGDNPPTVSAVNFATPSNGSVTPGSETATVLFGSQTGNAQRLAGELARRLQQSGVEATLSCMSEFKPNRLKKTRHLFVVVSTHGEGEPPDKAKLFYEHLHSKRAPQLEGVRFSVLSLGDLSYKSKSYCKMGKDFDRRLEELGAERLFPRADCDVDFEDAADGWMNGVLTSFGEEKRAHSPDKKTRCTDCTCSAPLVTIAPLGAGTTSPPTVSWGSAAAAMLAPAPVYTRARPFAAEVLENINLNGRGSNKETRHLKLAVEGSGLEFEPGDSLGIYAQNHPELVDQLIETMGWNPDEPVPAGKQERPLREALTAHYEVTLLTRPLLEQIAPFSRDGLHEMVEHGPAEKLDGYLGGRDLLDLTRDFSLRGVGARDFVTRLRKMPARLYSIASSPRANPDEIDVLVAAVRYRAHDRDRHGTCSIHCAERVQPGDSLPVYVQSNPNFRMPRDPDAPLIMIGPGTGVAPFRAFLEDREETGASGKTWLFFGDRRFRTDFLYQTEWLRWLRRGVLTRMDVAFSRDQDQKIYVQHRMTERGRDLFAWLEEGAYVYVCGDANGMAHDVHSALESVVEREGRMSAEDARTYVAALQQQGRYQRDVY